jgi:MFS family permease
VAVMCMTKCPVNGYTGQLHWTPDEEGLVFAAQNAGSLLMLATGAFADRLNGKLMVLLSVILGVLANLAIPLLAPQSFWFAVGARLLVGASDACLQPSVNSLITRWFPGSERPAAIGFITGGRQIGRLPTVETERSNLNLSISGTLFILPTAGYLCTRKDILDGWPAIFYLSAAIGAVVVLFWLPFGADKPSKQMCISMNERLYIESRVACESLGKRKHRAPIPWRSVLRSKPLWAGIFALICHEYPLVIMLQFLPNYLRDVLEFAPAQNGLIAALPIACLWLSKTFSSSLSSLIASKTKGVLHKTTIVKLFNAVASGGLAVCVAIVPLFSRDTALYAIASLCGAMAFAGQFTINLECNSDVIGFLQDCTHRECRRRWYSWRRRSRG